MIFKSRLLSQTGWENNNGLNIFKMQQNGEILQHYKEITSSYRAGTKFIRNTGISDVDSSSKVKLI